MAPHPLDIHPDHEAVGRAAFAEDRPGDRALAYGIWLWHWASPGDPRYDWSRARALRMTRAERAAKAAAIACYASQTAAAPGAEPVVGPEAMQHHTRPVEVLFTVGAR